MNKLLEAFASMRKDGNGLTLTQEQVILAAVKQKDDAMRQYLAHRGCPDVGLGTCKLCIKEVRDMEAATYE